MSEPEKYFMFTQHFVLNQYFQLSPVDLGKQSSEMLNVAFSAKFIDGKIFTLALPYFVYFSIPLSFIGLAKANRLPPCNLVTHLLNIKVFCQYRKGCDLTNQQPISINKYVALTIADVCFFKALDTKYSCLVDSNINTRPFDDFLLQLNINIARPFSFSHLKNSQDWKLVHTVNVAQKNPKSGAKRVFSKHNFDLCAFTNTNKKRTVEAFRVKFLGIENGMLRPSIVETEEKNIQSVHELILKFWTHLTRPTDAVKIEDFSFKSAVFDIETGYCTKYFKDLARAHGIPTPLSGFVQLISIRECVVRKILDQSTIKDYILIFVNGFDAQQIIRMFEEMREKYMYWLRRASIVCFENELDFLHEVLCYLSLDVDYIFGYNSEKFDFPFLTTRYNVLADLDRKKVSFLTKPEYSVRFILFSQFAGLFVSSIHKNLVSAAANAVIPTFYIKCNTPACVKTNELIYLAGRDFVAGKDDFSLDTLGSVSCLKCKKVRNVDFSSIEFKKHSNRVNYDVLPFTFHLDLFRCDNFDKVENKQLETVTGFFFREELADIVELCAEQTVRVRVARLFTTHQSLVEFINLYMINIKLKLFKRRVISNRVEVFFSGRLEAVELYNSENNCVWTSSRHTFDLDTCEQVRIFLVISTCGIDSCQIQEAIQCLKEKNEPVFVSVGKTSSITLQDQLVWKSEYHVVETAFYCFVDVLLTFNLEVKFKTLLEIFNCTFIEELPNTLLIFKLRKTSGKKVLTKINKQFIQKNLLVNIRSPQQIELYFHSALKVEGLERNSTTSEEDFVRTAEDVPGNDSVVKVKVYNSLINFMRFEEINCCNINEYHFGIIGDCPFDDLQATTDAISRICCNTTIQD